MAENYTSESSYNYTSESSYNVTVNDSVIPLNITLPPNGSSPSMPTGIIILIGVLLSLIIVIAILIVVMTFGRKRPSEVSNSETKSHSTLSDLPSSGLKSIVIENNSLKQVKSRDFFKWKSEESNKMKSNENENKYQTKSDENKSKTKTKQKDEKNELKKEIKVENSKTIRLD